jgi:hypothetical protein
MPACTTTLEARLDDAPILVFCMPVRHANQVPCVRRLDSEVRELEGRVFGKTRSRTLLQVQAPTRLPSIP